jgi:hypothetical protein
MLVVERSGLGTYAADEATVASDDVRHESIKAEEYNLPFRVHD